MIKKFFIKLQISIKGGLDIKYLSIALKYLGKAIQTITIITPFIKGLSSIWKNKKD